MTKQDRFAFLPEELVAAMEARGEQPSVIVRDLARYYDMVERGRKSLVGLFSDSELRLLADMTASTVLDANFIDSLPSAIEDAIADNKRNQGEDLSSITGKVRSLDHAALYALLDGIERFWMKSARQEETTPQAIANGLGDDGTFIPFTRYDSYFTR